MSPRSSMSCVCRPLPSSRIVVVTEAPPPGRNVSSASGRILALARLSQVLLRLDRAAGPVDHGDRRIPLGVDRKHPVAAAVVTRRGDQR